MRRLDWGRSQGAICSKSHICFVNRRFWRAVSATDSDDFFTTPLTSYGTQKAICELLLSDYSRRGIFDGIGLRLPTICIRPGAPNKAASWFFSNILREPLVGVEAVLPVDDNVRHWFASPKAATGFMLHAARLGGQSIGSRRNLTMPGLSATVAEEIEALRRVAGEKAVKLIRRQPDETIQRIVAGWPSDFIATRAVELGFRSGQGISTRSSDFTLTMNWAGGSSEGT